MVVHTYNPSTWKAKARGSAVLGQPQPHSKFENSPDYIETLSENKKWKKYEYLTKFRGS